MKVEDNRGYEREDAVKKAKMRKRKRRKKQTLTVLISLALIALITLIILSLTIFFKIEEINVTGSNSYSAQEIIKSAQIKKGDNLFLVSQEKISKTLQKELPFISEVVIQRELPSTLNLTIKETGEEVVFVNKDKIFSADSQGKILKTYTEKPEEYITITVSDKTKMIEGANIVFETEREQELFVLFMAKIEEYGYNVDFINISDPYSAYMKIEGRIIVKFGSSAYFDSKAAYLKASLSNVSKTATGIFDLSAWTPQNNKTVLTYCDISDYEK